MDYLSQTAFFPYTNQVNPIFCPMAPRPDSEKTITEGDMYSTWTILANSSLFGM